MAWYTGDGSQNGHATSYLQFTTFTGKFKSGRATVTAGQTKKSVVFAAAYTDANFTIAATAPANVGVWVDNKAKEGFDINISAAQGGDINVEWITIAD